MNKADISTPVPEYTAMAEHWVNINALMSGELVVKGAGEKFLPREAGETLQAYKNRLNRSSLYNLYKPTVESLSGEPFVRPVILKNEPSDLTYLQQDADTVGSSLTNFARDVLLDTINYGKAHILVDYPSVAQDNLTLADTNELNIRPYFVRVSPTNLIGWDIERAGGIDVLTSIRIYSEEWIKGETNPWERILVRYVRHYTPNTVSVFRQVKSDWVLEYEGINSLGKIPLVTIGSMVSLPPLEGLANLNIRHYQKLSDLDNIEHIANVPILFGSGFSDTEVEGIQIGPNRLISSTDPNATLQYVEHSGNAIRASQESIKLIESRMMILSASILQQRNQQRETAVARIIDKSEALSDLQIMVRDIENGLIQAYKYAADWIGSSLNDFQVDIGESLSIPVEANATNDLLNLQTMGILSTEDLVEELKRRGILSARFSVNREQYFEGEPTGTVN